MNKNKIKIAISYPPLVNSKGNAFLGQNRQFQWTNTGNVILPVIPAYGATALQKLGYKVFWDDAIAEKIDYDTWLARIIKYKPNIIFIESKTPVIKRHWEIINELKKVQPKLITILMGDHTTALPEESLDNSKVDYVMTGGDYDFMMINLVDHLFHKKKLEPGFYWKKKNTHYNSGKFALKHHNLDSLPIIDRKLTNWKIYGYQNTNFKYKPAAYIMTGRDCWWGKCTFCSWTTTHPGNTFRNFSVTHTIKELKYLASLGIREVFDDAGTLPIGPWLKEFCDQLIKTGLNKKITFGCNMRFGALTQEQYDLMGKANFRFILYGLESSNQNTLDHIVKNTKVEDSRKTLIMAKKAGLQPHLTIMVGYPWESKQDAITTLDEARALFKDGLADSMQATIVVPYPGTPLFTECKNNHWLKSEDWNDYDMRIPVMKSPISNQEQLDLVQGLFKGILTPAFLWRKITSIRNIDDITYLANYAVKYLKKLQDFPKEKTAKS